MENMYIILRRAVGGREESSDVRGELERENLWLKVLEVGRSQSFSVASPLRHFAEKNTTYI